jgi:diphosphomevalonate decarboxylase
MTDFSATAIAHPNIAFIKYWGNRNDSLRLPMNGSISMNLGSLYTQTTVSFSEELKTDTLIVNGSKYQGDMLARVTRFLNIIRRMAEDFRFAAVESTSNFSMGAGIASSAAAFAALALAGSAAAGLEFSEAEYSRLARKGSGSACRSIPGGFCEWLMGEDDESSIAVSIAPADHWPLTDLIAVVSGSHKKVGSTAGHSMAATSPYQQIRVTTAPERLLDCRNAILKQDFYSLAEVSEQDSMMMHAVMMTQTPPLFYWEPASLEIMKKVTGWREEGIPCFATLDAGPNVHILCPSSAAFELQSKLKKISGLADVIRSEAGGPARLV